MAGMPEFHRSLEKAELHVHLEGSIEPETLRELDPSLSLDEIRERYEYDDFTGFLRSFAWVARRLQSPRDYALITRRLLERLEAQNVRYAEIILAAGVVLWKEMDLEKVDEAVQAEAAASRVDVWWIWDAVRQFPAAQAQQMTELAARRVGDGVAAIGLGGDEARGPAHNFAGVFRYARDHGLRLTCHAGETAGPESVWAALEIGAERIGHGIRAIGDPALVAHLAAHRVPLEISITSNVRTGAVARLEDHPVRKLYEAGVPVVLNTDDPAMFQTTLVREYELAEEAFGFTREELRGLAENGFRYAFNRS